jgi:HemY protein
MRSVIWILLLGAAAAVTAIVLGANDGLVAVHAGHWRVDLSLNLFLLALLLACLVVVGALRLSAALWTLPGRASRWRAQRRERSAQESLHRAWLELTAGRFTRARQAAGRAYELADASEPPWPGAPTLQLVAAQLAADAHHRLQDRPGRDAMLDRALARAEAGGVRAAAEGLRLMAVAWAVEDRDFERARSLLAGLPPGVARRTQALRLKLQIDQAAERGEDALQTARLLAKHQAFHPTAAQSLLRSLASKVLDAAHDAEQLRAAWQRLDAAERRDPLVATHAARRAVALGVPVDARAWLKPLWDRRDTLAAEDRALVASTLADALEGLGSEWVASLEEALASHLDEPDVAVLVGLAFVERGLWGKALSPLRQAAEDRALEPRLRRRAWRTLAQGASNEGDEAMALRCTQEAAAID